LIGTDWAAVSLERTVEAYAVGLPDRDFIVDTVFLSEGSYSLLVDGTSFDVTVHRSLTHYLVTVNGSLFEITLRDPKRFLNEAGRDQGSAGPASVSAAMPGKLVRFIVAEGDSVKEGQGVAVVEAMKMQNELKAPKSGTVLRLFVPEGQAVNA